ncbi:MAG: sugar phosphate isomerase/epimerase family protein [Bacteroidota bacterium]
MNFTRRKAIKTMGAGLAAYGMLNWTACANKAVKSNVSDTSMKDLFFKISLAQWSLHRTFFGEVNFLTFANALQTDPDSVLKGKRDPIDFPMIARKEFGVDAVEFVNTFYYGKVKDKLYMKDLKDRCNSEGVQPVLIMCDALGNLGDTDAAKRKAAVENHYPWVEAAKFLGCHSIRVNAAGEGTADEVRDAAVQGLGSLSEYGAKSGISVIVENHGGYSSDGQWLASVMQQVGSDNCGTLPDFGNFCIKRKGWTECEVEYDRYQGMRELMPFAKGVSAKTHDFDADGNEIHTDFRKMLQIVKDAGYTGYIDIEYEGRKLSEPDGIRVTKKLLELVGAELS